MVNNPIITVSGPESILWLLDASSVFPLLLPFCKKLTLVVAHTFSHQTNWIAVELFLRFSLTRATTWSQKILVQYLELYHCKWTLDLLTCSTLNMLPGVGICIKKWNIYISERLFNNKLQISMYDGWWTVFP